MAAIFQIRRGTTANKPTLVAGELYVDQTSENLIIGVNGSKEITLLKLNDVNTGSLHLTGDIRLSGSIFLGDNSTQDNISVVGVFTTNLVPSGDSTKDIGTTDAKWRNVYATSISGAIAATNGVISGSSQIATSLPQGVVSGSSQVIGILNSLNSLTGSYATTGSNIFIGNQTISGSLTISGSSTFRNIGPTILSGSVLVSGSINSDGFELDASLTQNIPALNTAFNLDFSGSSEYSTNSFINKSLVLGDGKVLIAGKFQSIDGHTTNDIARLNSNGTIDTSFTAPLFSGEFGEFDYYINTFVTQSDNKIIVGGNFSQVSGSSRRGLARLNSNGTLDTSFVTQSWGSFEEVRDIAIQNDNKIVCVGYFTSGSRRFNTDGTPDTSFNISSGSNQPSFFNNDYFHSVALLNSGSEQAILIGGSFTQWGSLSDYDFLVKLHPNGTLDSGFAGTNLDIATGNSLDRIKKIKVGDDGYIYVAGRFRDTLAGPNVRHAGFARLTTTDEGDGIGAFESGFRTYISGSDQNLSGVSVYVNDFDFYDGNKILLGGNFITFGIPGYSTTSANRFAIVRQNTGNLISGWAASGSASTYNLNTGSVNSVTLIPSTTNVLVGGTFTSASSPQTAREGLASLKLAGFGNVTTNADYSITANVNELLVSSSNTYFTGNITASVISASFVGDGSGLTGVTAGDVEFANILNKPTLISGSSQLSGTTITDLTIVNLTTVNETASVIFSSGSNRFGDFGDDIHSFTGSVQISGSFTTIGASTATSFNGQINATNGVVSGSSQTIANLPTGTISSSAQIIANLPTDTISGSAQITTFGFVSSSVTASSIVTASVNINVLTFTKGNGSTFDVTVVASGTAPAGTISGSAQITTLGFISASTVPAGTISSSAQIIENLPTGVVSGSSQITYASISSIPAGIISGSSQILGGSGIVSGAAQIVPLLPTGVISGSSQILGGSGIVSGAAQIVPLLPTGVISGSSQILGGSGVFSGSSQVDADSITNFDSNVKAKLDTDGVISGSSQVTVLLPSGVVSGSSQVIVLLPSGVVSGSSQTIANLPTGVISGSSQILGGTGIHSGSSGDYQFNSIGVGTAASTVAGEIRATADITAFYSSDIRLKENIQPIQNALEKVELISGNTYDWKEGYDEIHSHKGNDVGVIAQEIEQILPQIVTNRDNGYKAVQYEKIIPLLIEAIKELSAKINSLENK